MQGIIITGSNNVFEVDCDDRILRRCSLKGKKLKGSEEFYNPLCPGDCVQIEKDSHTQSEGQILSLIPRKNSFMRHNIKGRAPQLLAANVDLLLCVTTPHDPPFRPRFIDRMLIQAEKADIKPVIVCNKCDLNEIQKENVQNRLADWQRLGYTVLNISAKTGQGLTEFANTVQGKLCVLAGQSGVGKSSIINALDSSFALRVAALSEKYNRGTHTTTKGILLRVQLTDFASDNKDLYTSIIDTPGVRRFVLCDIDERELPLFFPEMKNLVGQCTFGMSCSHTHEPGCKILEGVQKQEITAERYESWMRICDEIKNGIPID
ncbi:MAG: ribosome small subunit-dependent GTPase A [Spirochaetales bacterium]